MMPSLKSLHQYQRKQQPLNLILFITYGLTLLALSLKQGVQTEQYIIHQDKVGHLLAYGIFTLLGARISQSANTLNITALGIFIYSGIIEVLQHFVGREMSLLDLVANGAGVIVMLILIRQQSYATNV